MLDLPIPQAHLLSRGALRVLALARAVEEGERRAAERHSAPRETLPVPYLQEEVRA
ncbi:hypothetical protein [Acidithiobacillus sp. IBUN Pt1247-S3]|uniref:hypothetical protein n=1 Tax=Acidithiobacillus sp. IBUN Pt1247-S3 TaxID=3166642 RepID=UPI0034E37C8A